MDGLSPSARRAAALLTGLVCCALLAAWILSRREGRLEAVRKQIPSIMGTETQLTAVVEPGDDARAAAALESAEVELRAVEYRMSAWSGATELSRLNRARAGEPVPLSAETLEVLRGALDLARTTGGAFDPTCRPLLMLWKRAEERDREPDRQELAGALRAVGFGQVALRDGGAVKARSDVSVDLGAIAKGYAVDRAVEAMRRRGARGGMVRCGGDLRVFGPSESGGPWRIGIKPTPAAPRQSLPDALFVADRAVSTSGDSERFYTIQGHRYSHIVDPRTGLPVRGSPLVVVVGPRGVETDGWSTALSVTGPAGLAGLPPGLEAMVVAVTVSGATVYRSPGFATLSQPGR